MADLAKIAGELKNGECVLYLGMGNYKRLELSDGSEVPFDSDSIILALNDGRPMALRLMY
jgi:ferric-dicitrate binding protein FerR (iron transport regulator)